MVGREVHVARVAWIRDADRGVRVGVWSFIHSAKSLQDLKRSCMACFSTHWLAPLRSRLSFLFCSIAILDIFGIRTIFHPILAHRGRLRRRSGQAERGRRRPRLCLASTGSGGAGSPSAPTKRGRPSMGWTGQDERGESSALGPVKSRPSKSRKPRSRSPKSPRWSAERRRA